MIYFISQDKKKIIGHNPLTDEMMEFKVIGGGEAVEEKAESLHEAIRQTARPRDIKKAKGGGIKAKKAAGKPWNKKYDACIECGTTEKKHTGHGLCSTCYWRQKTGSKKTGESKKKSGDDLFKYECLDCFEIVTYKEPIDTEETKCPHKNCGGTLVQKF